MENYFSSFDEYLNESGIRGMTDLAKQYKQAELYFHIDLDGVTSAIGMKAYLESYGIKVIKVHPIQYGNKEWEASKPKKGNLAVLVDFAHGKPVMHIHTDHHQGQIGVVATTSTSFKGAKSNAGTISQEISPKDLFPNEDIHIINTVDSADFASQDIKPDDVIRAAWSYDKSVKVEKNHLYMGLVCNKVLLAFKGKPGFLEEVVMKAKPSLISIFTIVRKIAVDKNYGLDELVGKGETYQGNQDGNFIQINSIEEIFKFNSGEYTMIGNTIVQYGGGKVMSGGYDRYTAFKNHPEVEYQIIGWPMGIIQASKNPFINKKNPTPLGEISKKVINKYKGQLQKIEISFGDMKRAAEGQLWKIKTKDSFGFTLDDMEAMLGDVMKTSPWAKKNRSMLKDISIKRYNFLSPKQKAVLDNITTNMYDIVIAQSGGHTDITNISGFSFLPKEVESAKWVKLIMIGLIEEMKDLKLK